MIAHQMRHALDQDTGLPGAGTCDDEKIRFRCRDRALLFRI